MKLFKLDNGNVLVTEEALTLKAFSVIYKRDKTHNKEQALKEFAFMYFLLDPRSEYMHYTIEDERAITIKLHLGIKDTWDHTKDSKLQDAFDVYKSLVWTTSARALRDSNLILDETMKELTEASSTLSGVDSLDSRALILKMIQSIPKLAKEITETEKVVFNEIDEAAQIRGDRARKILDDGVAQLFE